MSPKQAEKMEKNLLLPSSSEEEEDFGSEKESGEKTECSDEESNKEESYVAPLSSKKPEANSEAEPSKKKPQNTLVFKQRPESSLSSPSEEEDEESDSIGEESESPGQESEKEEFYVSPLALKKPESDTEAEPTEKKKKKPKKTAVTKPRPESSKAKRSLENADDDVRKKKKKTSTNENVITEEEVKNKKKMKTPTNEENEATEEDVKKKKKLKAPTTEEHEAPKEEVKKKKKKKKKKLKTPTTEERKEIKEEVKKTPLFQRIFSNKDAIALLQAILDFNSERGDPYKDMDAFYEYASKLISFEASKSQLVTKVQRLKTKFENTLRRIIGKGKSEEDPIVFSKAFEKKTFELSRMIWGHNGVLASKSRKKFGGNSKEETPNVARAFSREIASFFKGENMVSYGLDESKVIAGWDMVEDGPKKRAMEEKLKMVKAIQMKLCSERIRVVAYAAKVILEEMQPLLVTR